MVAEVEVHVVLPHRQTEAQRHALHPLPVAGVGLQLDVDKPQQRLVRHRWAFEDREPADVRLDRIRFDLEKRVVQRAEALQALDDGSLHMPMEW